MPACFDGALAGGECSRRRELVLPAGLARESIDSAPRVQLLAYEAMFAKTPLSMASFPALAFRLARASADVLKASLAVALADHPELAGRLCGDTVSMTNEGVPFTVVRAAAPSAPEHLEEPALRGFADWRRPQRVRRGLEPPLTVQLTQFRDGSAVLAMCRSHALLDGTSAWTFLGHWAAAARGEAAKAPAAGRSTLRALVPGGRQLDELAQEMLGRPLADTWMSWVAERALPPVAAVMDSLFLSGISFPNRPRLFFSNEEVARIKAAATPAPGCGGDGWVSTQEALSAYLLLTVGQEVLPESSEGRALLFLLLDSRKALGLPEGTCFGSGLAFVGLKLTGLLQLELAEVAGAIHAAAKEEASPEAIRRRWQLVAGSAEQGREFDAFTELQAANRESDLVLQLNNQSKRQLPDFGVEGSGGPAHSVLTNAGPTLLLPASGGVEVFVHPSFLKGSATSRRGARALQALRSRVPPARKVAAVACGVKAPAGSQSTVGRGPRDAGA
mmetsp:Transcript_99956/g.278354  ORF Transcript_99956/g.278354 Transcript_99956/m.278354 type:complete len:503 (-) Transcript_99956:200-1708(-)